MKLHEKFDIFDCPLCHGAGYLNEEGGWAFTVQCADCGCQTAPAEFRTPQEREEAASAAVRCWNMGKVVHTGPGD